MNSIIFQDGHSQHHQAVLDFPLSSRNEFQKFRPPQLSATFFITLRQAASSKLQWTGEAGAEPSDDEKCIDVRRFYDRRAEKSTTFDH